MLSPSSFSMADDVLDIMQTPRDLAHQSPIHTCVVQQTGPLLASKGAILLSAAKPCMQIVLVTDAVAAFIDAVHRRNTCHVRALKGATPPHSKPCVAERSPVVDPCRIFVLHIALVHETDVVSSPASPKAGF